MSNVSVICPGCNEPVELANFRLSFDHCDTCEVRASIAMQHDVSEDEAREMAAYHGEES